MLTGDVNLMNVTDPQVPFARVRDTLRQADVLFGNLECCFYEPAAGHPLEREGFYAPLASAEALVIGGYHAVGNANNVNYGEEAIRSSSLSYAILRPAVLFGDGDILLNNIAWLLRHFPLFAIPGNGKYGLQPIASEDRLAS